jgi:hypothetical protein
VVNCRNPPGRRRLLGQLLLIGGPGGRLRALRGYVLGVGGGFAVLGGPVAVRVAFEGLEHLGPAGQAEIAQALIGRAVEGHLPPRDQDQQTVAVVEVGHAVRDDDHRSAVVGQVPHLFHDRLVQAGIQAGGRLIEEQQRRLGQQFLRDVDPLELPAGQAVRPRVRVLGQAELGHHLVDAGVALGGLGVRREAELGRVLQRAAGRQLRMQHAFLRHQADAVPELGVVPVQVPVVVQHGAGVRGPHAGQGAEQCRLARAARADDAEQALLGNREGHAVEQHLAARHLDDQVLRAEGDLAVVDELPQFAAGQPERRVPDADDVRLAQDCGRNSPAIHVGAVVAAEVDDLVRTGGRFAQFGVMARNVEVRQDQVIIGNAADAHGLGR